MTRTRPDGLAERKLRKLLAENPPSIEYPQKSVCAQLARGFRVTKEEVWQLLKEMETGKIDRRRRRRRYH